MHKDIHNMNDIGFKIRQMREQKNYSQEFMASKLDMSQASYARIESQEIKLSIDRLQKIAEILEADISTFFNSTKLTIQNQTNHDGSYGNGYIENLHIENKETNRKLVQTLEQEIEHLKTEIDFLRAKIK
jgi:transcriptional regulator with XRE-family HTH domain